MATMTVEECRQYLPSLAHLPDSEIEKLRDKIYKMIHICLDMVKKEWVEKQNE